jgi:hypothetical protein
MNNNQDLAQLLAASGGNAQLLGLGGMNPMTGLPNAAAANGVTVGADALYQSLLQRHAAEKFAALNTLGMNSMNNMNMNNLTQGNLQMLLQQKQLQDLQTLTLARSMGMGAMFNPMVVGGGGFDALALLQQQQQQQDALAQESTLYAIPPDRRRKGRTGTFPQKLHQLLADLEQQEGGALIASFLPHGRAFAIHKPRDFVKTIMPRYFRMSRFSSFQRQLNLYEFERITEGTFILAK